MPRHGDTTLYGDEWSTSGTEIKEFMPGKTDLISTSSVKSYSESSSLENIANRINQFREVSSQWYSDANLNKCRIA